MLYSLDLRRHLSVINEEKAGTLCVISMAHICTYTIRWIVACLHCIIWLMSDEKGTRKFFFSINKPEEWKQLLAVPDMQWKTGYSAKAVAYAWHEVCIR